MPSQPITAAPQPDPALPAALRDLAAVLVPGTVISGRVLEALGEQKYAVQLRGRTLIAESGQPLAKGEVVRVQVDSVGDQIRARLLLDDGASGTPMNRLQALGMPATPAGMLVLSAFERLGAPLMPDRLQVAVAQVEQAFDLPPAPPAATAAGTRLPPPPERLADAFALLARANLPVTAPLMSLALRAAQGELPNSAAALDDLRQVAVKAGLLQTASATTAGTPSPLAFPSSAPAPAPANAAGAMLAPQPGAAPISNGVTPSAAPSPGASPSPLPNVVPAELPLSSRTGPALVTPPLLPPTAAAPLAPQPTQATQPPTSASASTPAAVPQVASALPGVVPTGTIPTAPVAVAGGVVVAPPLAPSGVPLPTSAAPAADWRMMLATPLPDGDRDGAEGVMRALTLAGIRMQGARVDHAGPPAADASAPASTRPVADAARTAPASAAAPLVQHLALLMQTTGGDPAPAARTPDAALPLPAPVAEAAVRVAHEQSAQTVFPPDDLADYDRVVGLPLMANGQPVPARVAVASRNAPGGGGAATFLRVDAELSRLGPVSIRLSGVEGGAMAITLVAAGTGARSLAESLPDLAADLRHLGLTAGLRVVDDDGVEHAGATSHEP